MKDGITAGNGKKQTRDFALDQLKGLMLLFVAFGHVLYCYIDNGALEMTLVKYIYLFHMPLFAFLTGYFSRDADRARRHALTGALLPYLVFQALYIISAEAMMAFGLAKFSAETFRPSIMFPTSAFYYLLCVYLWKVLLPDFIRLRHLLPLSIILALAASLTNQSQLHTGLGSVFTLLPFFILGVKCCPATLERIRRIPRPLCLATLAAGWAIAKFTPYAMHSFRFTYADCGMTPLEGMGYRLLFYLTATAMGAAIIGIVPASGRRTWLSSIGEGAILAYAGSTFLSPHAYLLFAGRLGLTSCRALNMAGMLAFSFAVVFGCSRPVLLNAYQRFQKSIGELLLRPSPPS